MDSCTNSQLIDLRKSAGRGVPLQRRLRLESALQLTPHCVAPPRDSGFDSPQGNVQYVGNFFVTQILDVAQHYRGAKRRIDPGQSMLDHDALLTIQRVIVR